MEVRTFSNVVESFHSQQLAYMNKKKVVKVKYIKSRIASIGS